MSQPTRREMIQSARSEAVNLVARLDTLTVALGRLHLSNNTVGRAEAATVQLKMLVRHLNAEPSR